MFGEREQHIASEITEGYIRRHEDVDHIIQAPSYGIDLCRVYGLSRFISEYNIIILIVGIDGVVFVLEYGEAASFFVGHLLSVGFFFRTDVLVVEALQLWLVHGKTV